MRVWSSRLLLVTCAVGFFFAPQGRAQIPLPLDSSGTDLRAAGAERTTAACCLVDGSCLLLEEWECQLSGGFWMGGTGSCDPSPCPEDLGACCMSSECYVVPSAYCMLNFYPGLDCNPNPCTTPLGACCIGTSCDVTSQEDCQGNWYEGLGCSPNPCSQDPGACCTDQDCAVTTFVECAGTWWEGLECDPNPCPTPMGACCMSGGWCEVMDPNVCAELSGQWMGLGIPCDPNPCPLPGACCEYDGSCTVLLEVECEHDFAGEGTVCYPNPCPDRRPAILSILDVGNDQGGNVEVTWARSLNEEPGSEPAVTEYAVYRRQDRSLMNPPSSPASRRTVGERAERAARTERTAHPNRGFFGSGVRIEGWDCVGVLPASGEDTYQVISPTLCDSTAQGGICWSVFFVSAVTENPEEFYDSAPDSGYSVDNLAPAVPTGLNWVIEFTLLGWDEAPEEDFAYFCVYGSDEPEFDEQNATFIGDTVEPQMAVSGFSYYHVMAIDLAGNRGGPATLGTTSDVGPDPDRPAPAVLALHPSYPNPMRTSIQLTFDLPSAAEVVLTIFDAGGRSVAVLLQEPLAAGRHSVTWDGKEPGGSAPSAGVYFCRLEADGQIVTRKLLLAR